MFRVGPHHYFTQNLNVEYKNKNEELKFSLLLFHLAFHKVPATVGKKLCLLKFSCIGITKGTQTGRCLFNGILILTAQFFTGNSIQTCIKLHFGECKYENTIVLLVVSCASNSVQLEKISVDQHHCLLQRTNQKLTHQLSKQLLSTCSFQVDGSIVLRDTVSGEALLRLGADDNGTVWVTEGGKCQGREHQGGILKLSRPGVDLQ